MACNKKFKQNEYSVQCTVCGLWVHKTCAGMSDEMFNFLDGQHKLTGAAYWACRSCTAYAQGMNHRMKEIETKLAEVKQSCSKNESDIKKVESEVEKLTEKVEKQAKLLEKMSVSGDGGVYEELREREARRSNVVMFGMVEAASEVMGRGRWDWDIKSCANLFAALRVELTADSIKFCRRVGERMGEAARPLVVGFYEESDKSKLLKCDTRGTAFEDVEICPDLTKKQRQEEKGMLDEAVKRNMELSSEDRAKNLVWTVVGRKGDRRLVKRFADREIERMRAVRGRGRATRGMAPTTRDRETPVARGRGRVTAGMYRPDEAAGEEVEVQEVGTRTRLNSKRGRADEEAEEEMPAAKH